MPSSNPLTSPLTDWMGFLGRSATGKLKRPVRRKRYGRGRPRRDEIEQRDHDLLVGALDHFLEKGYAGATVDAITHSLGMAKRTVYARYGDKHGLFKAALQRAIDDWVVPLDQLQALECADLEETLLGISRILVARMMSPAGLRLIRITNAESYRMPEIGAYIYNQGGRQIILHLSDLFRRRMAPDPTDMPDLEDLAMTFLNVMLGPARLNAWGLVPDAAAVEKLTRQRLRMFLLGALPRRHRPRPSPSKTPRRQ